MFYELNSESRSILYAFYMLLKLLAWQEMDDK